MWREAGRELAATLAMTIETHSCRLTRVARNGRYPFASYETVERSVAFDGSEGGGIEYQQGWETDSVGIFID